MLKDLKRMLESDDRVVRASSIQLVLDILSRVKIVDLEDSEVEVFCALREEIRSV
jgi:hypothetical protein